MRALAALLATTLALTLPLLPAMANEPAAGDPLTWFLSEGESSSFCGPYAIVADEGNITGYGTCGQGFAVGAGGQTVAPPHRFVADAGILRAMTVGNAGHAHLVFDILVNPGIYEVRVTVHAGATTALSGQELCDVSAPCDIPLAGPGADANFPDLGIDVDFPTIAGAFTPIIDFGGPDPSRIEAAGAWGEAYTVPAPTPMPLDELPPGPDLTMNVGRGRERCLALSLHAIAPGICPSGPAFAEGKLLADHWLAPRGLTLGRSADLTVTLAAYDGLPHPAPGSTRLDAALIVRGATALAGSATCTYDALPTTCTVPLAGHNSTLAWQDPMFLEVATLVEGEHVIVAGPPDGGTLTLHGTAWEPDTPPANPQPEGTERAPLPGPLTILTPLLAAAATRLRPLQSPRQSAPTTQTQP